MTFIQSLILGIIQGLTEFLPVSSSAHLVLVPYLLNWKFPQEQIFPFDVLVQLGTLVAVIIYFWNDLMTILKAFFKGLVNKEPFKDPQARMGWYLIVGTIPAGILGITIKDKVEAVFASPTTTALLLFGTAALLILSDVVSKRNRTLEDMTWWDVLWIGVFQAISIFPGISRSGATITGGMTRNFDRSSSARFSFLMSIPIMLGAGAVSMKDLADVPNLASFLPVLAVGFIAAAIVGYLSIHWLLSFIKRQKFWVFAVYCVVFACIVLLVGALRSTPVAANNTTSTAIAPQVATQTSPGLQPLNVEYTNSLDWLTPAISTCADAIQNVGLVTHILPTSGLDLTKADLSLRWGAPTQLDLYSAQIGSERLVLVTSPKNPLQSLNLEIARQVFRGSLNTWGALHTACPDCFTSSYDAKTYDTQSIALNFYSAEEDIQVLFDLAVMAGQPVARSTALAIPDPAAMVETVSSNPASLGFIPAHTLNSSLKEITLSNVDAITLQQPILAIAEKEPQGSTRDWLLCLQKVLNP